MLPNYCLITSSFTDAFFFWQYMYTRQILKQYAIRIIYFKRQLWSTCYVFTAISMIKKILIPLFLHFYTVISRIFICSIFILILLCAKVFFIKYHQLLKYKNKNGNIHTTGWLIVVFFWGFLTSSDKYFIHIRLKLTTN